MQHILLLSEYIKVSVALPGLSRCEDEYMELGNSQKQFSALCSPLLDFSLVCRALMPPNFLNLITRAELFLESLSPEAEIGFFRVGYQQGYHVKDQNNQSIERLEKFSVFNPFTLCLLLTAHLHIIVLAA